MLPQPLLFEIMSQLSLEQLERLSRVSALYEQLIDNHYSAFWKYRLGSFESIRGSQCFAFRSRFVLYCSPAVTVNMLESGAEHYQRLLNRLDQVDAVRWNGDCDSEQCEEHLMLTLVPRDTQFIFRRVSPQRFSYEDRLRIFFAFFKCEPGVLCSCPSRTVSVQLSTIRTSPIKETRSRKFSSLSCFREYLAKKMKRYIPVSETAQLGR